MASPSTAAPNTAAYTFSGSLVAWRPYSMLSRPMPPARPMRDLGDDDADHGRRGGRAGTPGTIDGNAAGNAHPAQRLSATCAA